MYISPKIIVHAFMIELDIQEKKLKKFENLCPKSMEICSLVASQILAEFRPERATYKTLHN